MSATIYRGKNLTKDDLKIFIKDSEGNYLNPFSITYTIYRFYNQTCCEEPILETIDMSPIIFGTGKFFAAWNMAKDLNVGKYRIKWHIRRYQDSPVYEEVEEFDVITQIDSLNYSVLVGKSGNLPHQKFGNQNICAG